MFACQECGRKFKSTKAALRAVNVGCPKCHGTDVDVDYDKAAKSPNPPDADTYAALRKLTHGQIMRAEQEDYEKRCQQSK